MKSLQSWWWNFQLIKIQITFSENFIWERSLSKRKDLIWLSQLFYRFINLWGLTVISFLQLWLIFPPKNINAFAKIQLGLQRIFLSNFYSRKWKSNLRPLKKYSHLNLSLNGPFASKLGPLCNNAVKERNI